MTKIRFTGFDGAAVFSGELNGVSAKFRQVYSNSILFIHCPGHILQLCLLSACEDIPEVQESLLTLKSLFTFINRSSIRLTRFNDIQTLLQQPQLKLVRWLHFKIRAVFLFSIFIYGCMEYDVLNPNIYRISTKA